MPMITIPSQRGRGPMVTVNVPVVAPEIRGPIIGSGDIDNADASMGSAALSAWLTQPSEFNKLTPNALSNIRNRGI